MKIQNITQQNKPESTWPLQYQYVESVFLKIYVFLENKLVIHNSGSQYATVIHMYNVLFKTNKKIKLTPITFSCSLPTPVNNPLPLPN